VGRERARQLAKRAAGTIAELALTMPGFGASDALTSRWQRARGATRTVAAHTGAAA
jgi:hypothetical protein